MGVCPAPGGKKKRGKKNRKGGREERTSRSLFRELFTIPSEMSYCTLSPATQLPRMYYRSVSPNELDRKTRFVKIIIPGPGSDLQTQHLQRKNLSSCVLNVYPTHPTPPQWYLHPVRPPSRRTFTHVQGAISEAVYHRGLV